MIPLAYKPYNTAQRLRQLMDERGLKQVDVLNACKPYSDKYDVYIRKNDLSQYLSGKVEPKQDKLTILGLALDVNEVWLMGYDINRSRAVSLQWRSERSLENLYERLDKIDQGYIIRSMKGLLKDDKYKEKVEPEGSKAAKAIS